MGGGTDGCGVYFCCDEEGYGIWAKLVEKGREKVHCLKTDDVFFAGEVFVSKCGNDEEDKVHCEADHLHIFAAVEFVIDEECWAVFKYTSIWPRNRGG